MSHHPPIICVHMETKDYVYESYIQVKIKVTGINVVNLVSNGKTFLTFKKT